MTTKDRMSVVKGSIVTLEVDAIVNAANTSLMGGGGVDGAIHRAAGPELVAECRMLNGCKVGQAKLTGGYELAARHVIHTVGPVWRDGKHHEARLLADCYQNSLEIACHRQLTSIAFPAISCGIYGYPIDKAVAIATEQVYAFINTHSMPEKVLFCCFEDDVYEVYLHTLEGMQ